MENRTCEFCGRLFKNGNSYRVHKSKYHREETLEQASDAVVESQPKPQVMEESTRGPIEETEETEEHSGSGWGWAAGLGGLVLFLAILFFGRGGGQE
jgi:hypothetical protein